MATKSTRKPITSSAKGMICLVVLLALTVFAACLSVNGMALDSEGVTVLLPWVPVSSQNWPASLPLSKALGGGTYTDYTITLDEGATAQDVIKTVKERLNRLSESDATVALNGDMLRVETRNMDATLKNSKLSVVTAKGHFEFADSTGNVILTESDIKTARVSASRLSSTSSTYTVTIEFDVNNEGVKKLQEANPTYLTVNCDGASVSSFASVDGNKITASMGTNDSAYTAATNYAFLMNYGAVKAGLNQNGTGTVAASSATVLKVVLILCAALLVCALVYLVVLGKLTGVSAFLAVLCTVILGMFFVAAVVIPSAVMLNTASLVAILLGILLAIYTAVTRTDAISKQIAEGAAPKSATKVGMKIAAKNVWIAHGAALCLSVIMMIFPFCRNVGYALSAMVVASAIATLAMRAFQLCFTAISNKPALFGKTK